MQRINESDRETIMRNGSARITGIEFFNSLTAQPASKISIGDNSCAMFFGDCHRITDMITMAVGQGNMGYALRGLRKINALSARIAVKKRINQDSGACYFNAKCRMTKPGDFHKGSPSTSIFIPGPDMTPGEF